MAPNNGLVYEHTAGAPNLQLRSGMMTKSYEEMAREEDALKDTDAEIDGLVPVKARVARDVRAVFSLRLAPTELSEIQHVARARAVSVGDFIRTAAIAAARGDASSIDEDKVTEHLNSILHQLGALKELLAPRHEWSFLNSFAYDTKTNRALKRGKVPILVKEVPVSSEDSRDEAIHDVEQASTGQNRNP